MYVPVPTAHTVTSYTKQGLLVYRLPALSKLLPVGCSGVSKANFLLKTARYRTSYVMEP